MRAFFCTGSLVGRIETAKKVPTRDFSERVDAALGTDGFFSRLAGLVLRSQLPHWFQPYAEMEAKAAYVSTYQRQLVYGLIARVMEERYGNEPGPDQRDVA